MASISKKKRDKILQLLKNAGGNIAKTCEGAEIDRSTFYRWRKKDEEFNELVQEILDACTDNVESALYKNALEGNVTAQIFYLKNKRPEVFQDRRQLEVKEMENFTFDPTLATTAKTKRESIIRAATGD